jgi:hypothetical protein
MMLDRWQAESVSKILSLGSVNLVRIISFDHDSEIDHRPNGTSFLFSLYSNVFLKAGQKRRIRVESLFRTITPAVKVIMNNSKPRVLGYDDLEKVKQLDLDFILNFDEQDLPDEILTIPHFGVWSFRNDDGTRNHGIPDCFWQVYDDKAVTGVVLERLTKDHTVGAPIWKGYFKTVRSSYLKNVDQTLAGCAGWPAQVCIQLQNGNLDLHTANEARPAAQPYRQPSNIETCLLILKTLKRRVSAIYRLLFRYTSWNVGIVDSPISAFLEQGFRPVIRWLPQHRNGHIQADPFGRSNGRSLTILFERLDYFRRKGTICAVEVSDNSPVQQPKVVIELPVHMSYPYIFEYKGETYCVPETNQAKEVPIYKALEFPNRWIKVGRLLENVRAIDTTVFQHNDRWWSMFTDRDRGGDANLYVWHAPDLWGEWKPHPLNPVKTDIRSARPGGTPFEHSGQLYRPAQDCSRTGGGSIIVNRVKQLTTTEFEEEPVAVVAPYPGSPYQKGLHTLSAAGLFTLIDGKRFRFIPSGLLTNVIKGFKKLKR